MNEQNPYRWHILGGMGFFLLLVMIFFAVASWPEKKIDLQTTETPEVTSPTISFIDPQIGAEEPSVTIVEFADFTCEACLTTSTTLARLLNAYPDDVRLVWKDFPNESASEEATPAAVAARCAAEQDAFWPYHDELFLRQSQLANETYLAVAEALGLNLNKFSNCLTQNDPLPRVRKDFEEGLALKITATPTLFINGERYTGSLNYDDLSTLVKSARIGGN